jgi:hypothetical protein
MLLGLPRTGMAAGCPGIPHWRRVRVSMVIGGFPRRTNRLFPRLPVYLVKAAAPH